jgi:hypothetical protein
VKSIKLESELAYELYCGEEDDCYKVVSQTYESDWRWGTNTEMVVQDLATGKFYAAICQEQQGDHYYNSFEEDSGPIEFYEVVPEEITVTKYVKVK